jgi:hypothetical protein
VKAPSMATKYFPELQGRQVSIKQMMLDRQQLQLSAASTVSKRDPSSSSVGVNAVAGTGTGGKSAAISVKKAKIETSGKITQFFAPKNVVAVKQILEVTSVEKNPDFLGSWEVAASQAELWIRIDLMRIRIQHFPLLRIRIQFRNPGF